MASPSQSSATNGPPGVQSAVIGPGSTATVSKMPLSVAAAVAAAAAAVGSSPQQQNFDPLDKSSSNTLKRNPKMELCKTDLLKLLGYLEGELQARDVVIAALKSEKMKHLLNSKYRHGTTDPHSALNRDMALLGGPGGSQSSQTDQQLVTALETLIARQRHMKSHMAKVLQNAEFRHRTVIKELEEEKQKHEHDTAQGDDITYGLEKERTRLKKELEMEKQEKKRLEAEAKKMSDTLEEEKNRHRQIVLILLAERKKIIMKYIEERKRSEDLAQILSEEKVRTDTMAEGLEEESKKSLHMEAEMEKQQAQFDIERSQFRQSQASKDKKLMDQQAEIEKLRAELEVLKDQQARGVIRTIGVTPPPPPAKPANLASMPTLRNAVPPQVKGAVLGAGTPMVSSKVVQPTATVSSVPVSGPTTGIARSVIPGQALRGAVFGSGIAPTIPDAAAVAPPTSEYVATTTAAQQILQQQQQPKRPNLVPAATPSIPIIQSVAAATTAPTGTATNATTVTSATARLPARGVPPPVPPNKPVVPKKEVTAAAAAFLRRSEQPSPSQNIIPAIKQQQQQQQQNNAVQPVAANQAEHEVKPR